MNIQYELNDYQDEFSHFTQLTINGETTKYNRNGLDRGKSGLKKRMKKHGIFPNLENSLSIDAFFKNHPYIYNEEKTSNEATIRKIVQEVIAEQHGKLLNKMEEMFLRFAPIMGEYALSQASSVQSQAECAEQAVQAVQASDENEGKAEELPDEEEEVDTYIDEELHPPKRKKVWKVRLGITQRDCTFNFNGKNFAKLMCDGNEVGVVQWLKSNKKDKLCNPDDSGDNGESILAESKTGTIYMVYDYANFKSPDYQKSRVHLFRISPEYFELFGEYTDKGWFKDYPYYCKLNFGRERIFDYFNWKSNWNKNDGKDMVFIDDHETLINYI